MEGKENAMTFRKLAIATGLGAALLAGPALAQTQTSTDGPLPYEKWDNSTRSMFFNEDMSLRADADIRKDWQMLTPERQAALKADCADRPNTDAGSSDLTNQSGSATADPVPGVTEMNGACNLIQQM